MPNLLALTGSSGGTYLLREQLAATLHTHIATIDDDQPVETLCANGQM